MVTSTTVCSLEAFKPYFDQELVKKLNTNKVKIIVIRHGEGTHNLNSLMNSSRSPGVYLTDKGILQVKNAAERLSSEKIDHVYVSPVYRTMQTAHYLTVGLGIPSTKLTVTECLREQHFGIFEGRSYYEYVKHFEDPEEVYTKGAPNGETGEELFIRTREFLHKMAEEHPNETVLFVTHGFNCQHINYCLTGSDEGVPYQAEFKIYSF